jgi:hypothetical protein
MTFLEVNLALYSTMCACVTTRLSRWFPPHVLANHRALCAAALIASTGVPWAVRMTVPYAITAKNYPSDALANASVRFYFAHFFFAAA